MQTRLLSRAEAIALDTELMNDEYAFSSVQLMELAGLACADAIRDSCRDAQRALVLIGPGNNGGDALVAARHLFHYGLTVSLHFPRDKLPADAHLARLRRQCSVLGIAVVASLPPPNEWSAHFDVIVDGLFGFSFDAANGVRAPYDATIAAVNAAAPLTVVALDIPSGWDVDEGNARGFGMRADVLVSLSAVKQCAKNFTGKHYLGGRFVPPALEQKYALNLPAYPSTQTFVLLQ